MCIKVIFMNLFLFAFDVCLFDGISFFLSGIHNKIKPLIFVISFTLQLLANSFFLACQPVWEGWQFCRLYNFRFAIPVCLEWPAVPSFCLFWLSFCVSQFSGRCLSRNHTGFPYLLGKLISASGSFIPFHHTLWNKCLLGISLADIDLCSVNLLEHHSWTKVIWNPFYPDWIS